MALILSDGFGKYGPIGTALSTTQGEFDTGYTLVGNGIAVSQGFSADNLALTLTRSSTDAPMVSRSVTTTSDTVIIGFEISATTRFTFFNIPGVVSIDWASTMSISGNAGTAIPILNTGYFVELKLTKSTKAYVMKLNGYPYINGTLTPTIPDTLVLQWGFPAVGAAASMKLSNLTIVDASTGKYTDFIGPQTIRDDRPTASLTPVTWTPTPSSKTNVQIMQNNPPVPYEFTQSNTVGDSDYYTSATTVSGAVTAVAISIIIGKTDIDSQQVKIGIGPSGTRVESGLIDVAIQPAYVTQVFEQDNTAVDWTASSATAIAFGATIQPRA